MPQYLRTHGSCLAEVLGINTSQFPVCFIRSDVQQVSSFYKCISFFKCSCSPYRKALRVENIRDTTLLIYMSLPYSIFELKQNLFAQHEITQNAQIYDSTPAHLHSETSSVRVLFLCCPHCVETGIQFLELATKQKPFDLYRLATGLRELQKTRTLAKVKLQSCRNVS